MHTKVTTAAAGKNGRAVWYDSPFQIALRALGVAVAAVLVMFIAAILVIPRFYGGQAFTVMSGSMSPAINAGDVIAVRGWAPEDVCKEIQIGEIITYFPHENDPTLVTHRVVDKIAGHFSDGTSCRLIPQGDANNTPDDMISPEQVRGQFMYGIPKVGLARDWVMGNARTAALVAIALFAIYYWISGYQQPKSRVVVLGGNGAPVGSYGGQGSYSGFGGAPAANSMPDAVFVARMRELDLRERELKLDEAEAAKEFGYVAPAW